MAKPKPVYIFREEEKNDKGEWVCVRMTYDQEKSVGWRTSYEFWCKTGRPAWLTERRFLTGYIAWSE